MPLSIRLRRLVLLLVLAAAAGASVHAQPSDDALASVESALREADAGAVLDGAAPRVEIVLFGQGGMYRRSQATHVLRDFFRRYPPERVAFSERSSGDDGRTAIGRYWAQDGGAPLTVRVRHRPDGSDGWTLVSVRVEEPSAFRASGE